MVIKSEYKEWFKVRGWKLLTDMTLRIENILNQFLKVRKYLSLFEKKTNNRIFFKFSVFLPP